MGCFFEKYRENFPPVGGLPSHTRVLRPVILHPYPISLMNKNCRLIAAAGIALSLWAGVGHAQSVTLELAANHGQTAAGALTQSGSPYEFQASLRHGNEVTGFSAWGPVLHLPGGGASTPNFTATPNTGSGDYMIHQTFATEGALLAAFPTGGYQVAFGGAGAPAPATFSAGIAFTSGGFASEAPTIVSANNGAIWSNGLLVGNNSITTLTLNGFDEYGTAPYAGTGTLITAGIFDSLGNVISAASRTSFYVPSLSLTDVAITELALNGAWLTPGVNYTLQIQYGILASAPGSALLDDTTFEGLAIYYATTNVSVSAIPEPASWVALAGVGALGLVLLRRRRRAA